MSFIAMILLLGFLILFLSFVDGASRARLVVHPSRLNHAVLGVREEGSRKERREWQRRRRGGFAETRLLSKPVPIFSPFVRSSPITKTGRHCRREASFSEQATDHAMVCADSAVRAR